MRETRGDLDLSEKPLAPEGRRELGRQYLDGYGATMLRVLREVDGRHPAPPDLTLDDVAPRECRPQLEVRIGHGAFSTGCSVRHRGATLPSTPDGWNARVAPGFRGATATPCDPGTCG